MNKISGIYKITSPTGKIYIGQSKNIHSRLLKYQEGHCKTQRKLYRSILKHGWENHKFEIIHKCDIYDLDNIEIKYIKHYNSTDRTTGLNLTSGGKRPKMSPETIEKLRHNSTGENNPMFNKKHSEETKEKIRQRALGRKVSEETRSLMSSQRKGKKKSEEWKRKIGLSKNRVKVSTIIDGNLVIFNSMSDASRATGVEIRTISMCITRNSKRSKPYIWKLA